MHRHPGRLVHHEQRVILVNHGELGRRGRRRFRCSTQGRKANAVARLQAVLRSHAAAIDAHLAAAQHPINMAFRHPFQAAQQEIVDALAVAVLHHPHGAGTVGGGLRRGVVGHAGLLLTGLPTPGLLL